MITMKSVLMKSYKIQASKNKRGQLGKRFSNYSFFYPSFSYIREKYVSSKQLFKFKMLKFKIITNMRKKKESD